MVTQVKKKINSITYFMVLREFYTKYFTVLKRLNFLYSCSFFVFTKREREAILSLYNIDSITVRDRSKYLLLVFQISLLLPLSPSAKVCIYKKYEHSVRRKGENNISIQFGNLYTLFNGFQKVASRFLWFRKFMKGKV
jgi:hypothetical protein